MNIIFDLDGTLIDSSQGILSAVDKAFRECGIPMLQPLASRLIGPPLDELLILLSGTDDKAILDTLSRSFKDNYDSSGYKETTVFEGVHELLKQLDRRHRLYLATNKRIVPTRKIMEYFSWNHYFEQVYALDLFAHIENKQALIAYIVSAHALKPEQTVYIGDTMGDYLATRANQLHFIMATWGYDDIAELSDREKAVAPEDIVGIVESLVEV